MPSPAPAPRPVAGGTGRGVVPAAPPDLRIPAWKGAGGSAWDGERPDGSLAPLPAACGSLPPTTSHKVMGLPQSMLGKSQVRSYSASLPPMLSPSSHSCIYLGTISMTIPLCRWPLPRMPANALSSMISALPVPQFPTHATPTPGLCSCGDRSLKDGQPRLLPGQQPTMLRKPS